MGSKVGKGITETNANDNATVTYSWTLKRGQWAHYLSPDRSWNWFNDECCVESPPFIYPCAEKNVKFRIGLKEASDLSAIVAYLKFPTGVEGSLKPSWEIWIKDVSSIHKVSCRPHSACSDANGSKWFQFVELCQDPPADASLTVHLTLNSNSSYSKFLDETGPNGSRDIFEWTNAEQLIWRRNMARLLMKPIHEEKERGEGDFHFDVTLIVDGGQRFNAHRCVLACHSVVFETMFRENNGFKESVNREVIIEDMTATALHFLLRYMYTGDFSYAPGNRAPRFVIGGDADADAKVPYMELLDAAEKYDLQGLKRLCERHLCDQLTPDNVCELILIADTYTAPLLKYKCLSFMAGREAKIGRSEAFKKLARQSSAVFKEVCSKLW